MLKQINIIDALNRALKGERIQCLVPCDRRKIWNEMQPDYLNDILQGVICLIDEDEEPEEESEPEPEAERRTPGRRRLDLDIGKVMALHRAGWPNIKIANEMGVSPATIQRCVNAHIEEGEKDGAQGS